MSDLHNNCALASYQARAELLIELVFDFELELDLVNLIKQARAELNLVGFLWSRARAGSFKFLMSSS